LAARAALRDRDLTRFVIPDGGVFQDFSLVLVPAMRPHCVARAWAPRVPRFARTGAGG